MEATVAGETDDVMIEDCVLFRLEARLGHLGRHRHAHRICQTLPEGTRRRFHAARRVSELWMARRFGTELAEPLDLLERHVGITAEMEPAVEEHRAVTG